MAATLTPYPPHHPQSATRITPAAALANISSYLALSETVPHLHPDAQLNPESIKFSTTGGPSGGLVLHNLRRVEKGLNGELLAPDEDELNDMFGNSTGDDANLDALAADSEAALNAPARRKGGLKKKSAYDDVETVDPETWAASQVILEGEVGERDPAGGVQEGYAEDYDDDAMDIDGADGARLSARDKAARKEEKKRRQKLEKKEKDAKRSNK